MRKILTWLFTIATVSTIAQDLKSITGLRDERDLYVVITHANIRVDPSTEIRDGMMIIYKNRITATGKDLKIPAGAVMLDAKGKYIYPAFIDMYSNYGLPDQKQRSNDQQRGPQYETAAKGAFNWNQAIHPEYDASRQFTTDNKAAEDYRKAGFALVLTQKDDGIARGTAALVTTGSVSDQEAVIKGRAAQCFSLSKGSSKQEYPSSLMGCIALLRQTYYDLQWYRKTADHKTDLSLEAMIQQETLPAVFEATGNYLNLQRVSKIGKEFNVNYIIKGNGDEYTRLQDLKNSGNTVIVPVDFPVAYQVDNPYDALNISLTDLKDWEIAPSNLAQLYKAGVPFAITASGLKDKSVLLKNLRKAVKYGLPEAEVLRALTITPAKLLGADKDAGSLKAGSYANFVVFSKPFMQNDAQLLETWVTGKGYIVKSTDEQYLNGNYALKADSLNGWMVNVSGDSLQPEWTLVKDSVRRKITVRTEGGQYTLRFQLAQGADPWRLNGTLGQQNGKPAFAGSGETANGNWIAWNATWISADTTSKKPDSDSVAVPGAVWYPNTAFGTAEPLVAHPVLIKNITVWTNEASGIQEAMDVLIADGKIAAVGKSLKTDGKTGLETIDGTGLHLTPGIIDEHSHIAVSGDVNEGSQAITAEVRLGDVLDPDDINIYRQLAGGVTTSHILHGSANPIGGQTALIKLRWGKNAEAMKFEGADPFIKFALGENVKQSNWGDDYSIRYPQTRMGVEQIYIDAFSRANEYRKMMANKTSVTPHRDLELDALAEILDHKRFITCHSYQQGEINMLMHVADTFKFTVNTFTHILEGYKVADKMKKHGAGASTFSDWWAYKYEVIEAIPYNAAVMHDVGIVTAMNSDDAEMARRLNQESAKGVKYGGVSEEEALKFVTLNPAKLLHIDNRVGSIKPGKDADLVIWNGNPLSVYSKPLKTFVDGIAYYDIAREEQLRKNNAAERERIIRLMMKDKSESGNLKKPVLNRKETQHCNDHELSPR